MKQTTDTRKVTVETSLMGKFPVEVYSMPRWTGYLAEEVESVVRGMGDEAGRAHFNRLDMERWWSGKVGMQGDHSFLYGYSLAMAILDVTQCPAIPQSPWEVTCVDFGNTDKLEVSFLSCENGVTFSEGDIENYLRHVMQVDSGRHRNYRIYWRYMTVGNDCVELAMVRDDNDEFDVTNWTPYVHRPPES